MKKKTIAKNSKINKKKDKKNQKLKVKKIELKKNRYHLII